MSNEFLDEFLEDPYMDEISGGDFKTIARAIIQPAYQGWQFGGSPKLFPYDGSKPAGLIAREKCADYCQGDKSYPQPGVLTIVYGDDVPSHPEGEMNQDWYDFVPVFHSRDKYTGQVDVQGEFPYDLVMEGLRKNREVFNQVQWCELSQTIDNVREPKRDKEQSKYARRVYVVERVFKNREEAYKAAGKDPDAPADDDFDGFGIADFSALAKKSWPNTDKLKEQSEVIFNLIKENMEGVDTPDSKPMKEVEAQRIVCETFGIEVSDLSVLAADEVVF